MIYLPSLKNVARQWLSPDEKIFFIGFNKCGTTAIHHFAGGQGVRSFHWRQGRRYLALEIEQRLNSTDKLKAFLSRWTAYSDMTFASEVQMIEANKYFRLFHDLFPRAYFVFNDRDEDEWIRSRKLHHNGRFLSQSKVYYNCDEGRVEEIWRRQYAAHKEAVNAFFSGSDRFLHFMIDRDSIEKLIVFLSPSFDLDAARWRAVNRTNASPAGTEGVSNDEAL